MRQLIGYVVLGFFAAFGVFCAFWTVFGGCYPSRSECDLTLRCPKELELVWIKHLCWLRQMGLLRLRLTVVGSSLSREQRQMIRRRYPYINFE